MDRFQSTYPHGVRPRLKHDRDMLPYFNPRTRTGYDSDDVSVTSTNDISIHVPARGTTQMSRDLYPYPNFNPRTRTGYDSTGPLSHRPRPVYFNPRTRTGYDGNEPVPVDPVSDFNPRTRTGYDGLHHRVSSRKRISIHVPARGTTLVVCFDEQGMAISIHVPARGTTSFFFRPSS